MDLNVKNISWWQKSLVKILRNGPIPKHIGFIMDGNRRFARNANMVTIKGHEMGFDSFTTSVTMGLELGVKEITTYALSIDNLKRPQEEMDGLWNLMEVKFTKILDRINDCLQENVVIKFIGNLALMPTNLQRICSQIETEMQEIKEPVITCYMAICYTSRDEITTSMKRILSEVDSGLLYSSDINGNLLQRRLNVSAFPVDMIIRTSGETRLSDFLLWQCSDAVLYFTNILWPEFSQWEMLKSIIYFQYCHMKDSMIYKNVNVDNEMKGKSIGRATDDFRKVSCA